MTTAAVTEHTNETPADASEHVVLLKVEEAARRLRIGRTTCFALIRTGALESIQIGRLRRVPATAIPEYIQRQRGAHVPA